jgi:hypothetical protein
MLEAIFVALMVVGAVSGWRGLVRVLQMRFDLSLLKARLISTVIWVAGMAVGFGMLVAAVFGFLAAWRWLQDKFRAASRAKAEKNSAARSAHLDVIRFKYKGRDDYIAHSRSVDVSGADGRYIEGFCQTRRAVRTFRIDRIKGEVVSLETGEVFETADAWRTANIGSPRNKGVSPVPQDTWKESR